MSGQAALYLRGGKVIVVPQADDGGEPFDVEPISVVESDAAAVAEAVANALAVSSRVRHEERPRVADPYASPVLDLITPRSYRHFYRGTTYCRVIEDEREVVVLKFGPSADRGGFEPTEDAPRVVDDPRVLGSIVIDCLVHSRKMPPA